MQLEISLIISQILAFLITLWILKRFAWKPLLKILEERKKKIQSEFSSIEEKKRENQALAELYTSKLKGIEEEAKSKIAEAIEAGKKTAQQIHEEAHNQARAILQKAKVDIENERIKAHMELKNTLITLIIDTTQKLIHERLDAEKDKKLIADFIEGLR